MLSLMEVNLHRACAQNIYKKYEIFRKTLINYEFQDEPFYGGQVNLELLDKSSIDNLF